MLRPGLAALVEHLMMRDYSSHAIGRIFDFVACNGTLEGSLVEDDDMAAAEACFVDALRPVPYDSAAWGDDGEDDPTGEFPTAELLEALGHEEATCISHEAGDGAVIARKMIDAGTLPPIAGGAPTYEPDDLDWREYSAWSRHLEELRDIEREREFYRRHPLSEFNDHIRNGD
jgi:hypothetical protein